MIEAVFSIQSFYNYSYYIPGVFAKLFLLTIAVVAVLLISQVSKNKNVQIGAWVASIISWAVYLFGVVAPDMLSGFIGREGVFYRDRPSGSMTASSASSHSTVEGYSHRDDYYSAEYGTFINVEEMKEIFSILSFSALIFASVLTTIAVYSLFIKKASSYEISRKFYKVGIVGGWLTAFALSSEFSLSQSFWGAPPLSKSFSLISSIFTIGVILLSFLTYYWARMQAPESSVVDDSPDSA